MDAGWLQAIDQIMSMTGPNHSILFLDQIGLIDETVITLLIDQGLTPTVLQTATDAFEAMKDHAYNLIVLTSAPDKRAIQSVCAELSKHRHHVRDRLLLMCEGPDCTPMQAAKLGIDDVLSSKPCWPTLVRRLKLMAIRLSQETHRSSSTPTQLEKAANLTTLPTTDKVPNHRYSLALDRYHESIQHSLQIALGEQSQGAILLVQIRTLKDIFRSFGYVKGTKLLNRFHELLIDCLRADDSVMGLQKGDSRSQMVTQITEADFVILMGSGKHTLALNKLSERIKRTIGDHVEVDGVSIPIVFSFGFAAWPGDGTSADDVLKAACQSIDNEVTNSVPVSRAPAKERKMLAALYEAIAQNEIEVFYQPKVAARSKRLVGFEALARWYWNGKFVAPDIFIPLAETSGLIRQLGMIVTEKAVTQHQDWSKKGLGEIPIAINVSPFQFNDEQFSSRILELLRTTQTNPSYIEIEITESSVLRHEAQTLQQLKILRDANLRVALDDFGTGFSSLAHLQLLELDTLKIDRSFINKLNDPASDPGLVVSIISIGISLGLNVVAEGIENSEQAQMLYEWGCHQLQGYYFSKPVCAADAELLIGQEHLPMVLMDKKKVDNLAR
ncbi:MAG: putative bifunctional diguanylate cyclase/phosphodiesterase [Woeseiaceae bacterium]